MGLPSIGGGGCETEYLSLSGRGLYVISAIAGRSPTPAPIGGEEGVGQKLRTIRPLLEEMSPLFENWGRRVKGFMYERKDQLEGMNRGDGPGLILKDLKLKETFRELLGELQGTDTCILVRSNREVEEMIKQLEEWGFFCEGRIQGNFFRSLPVRELYLLVSLLTRPVTPSLAYAFHCSSFGAGELGNSLILKDFHPDHPSFLTLWEKHPSPDGCGSCGNRPWNNRFSLC